MQPVRIGQSAVGDGASDGAGTGASAAHLPAEHAWAGHAPADVFVARA